MADSPSQPISFHPNGVMDLTYTALPEGMKKYEITSRRDDFGYTITTFPDGRTIAENPYGQPVVSQFEIFSRFL